MTEEQAREDIRIIKNMLEKTKKATVESVGLFLVWGFLITFAMAAGYVIAQTRHPERQWIVWTAATAVGWVASILTGIRRGRRAPVTSYVQTAARHLYIASGMGFLLVCFVFPVFKVYGYDEIPILFSAVAGILFFVMSGIYESPLMIWLGLFWWAGGAGMIFIKGDARILAFAGLFLIGYDIPALVLWLKHRRDIAAR
jgi:hypothetical protein